MDETGPSADRRRRLTGWAFVAVQVVVLVALVVLPGADDWPTPAGVEVVATVLVVGGLVLVAVAALGLGRSLTPTPVPVAHGQLVTSGLYRWVRHPIYSGVLAVVAGLVLGSGNLVTAAVGVATVVFFHVKAGWEEARLAERFPGYADYAAATPRFVPRPGGRPGARSS